MSEQLDIFGGNSVVQVGPSKVAKAEKVQSKTTNKPRYGVCECGSGEFNLSVKHSVYTRKCKNKACGKEIIV